MKKFLLAACIALLSQNAKAQIVTEAVYPGGSMFTVGFLRPVQLTGAGFKYWEFSNNQIELYNLNHTVYHTINMPALPPGSGYIRVSYVSDALFDLNTSDIEFIVQYTTSPSNSTNHVAIYRENGTLLFLRDTVGMEPAYSSEVPDRIFRTPAGTKMILSSQLTAGAAIVIGLPGSLPCNECGAIPLGVQPNENTGSPGLPYPNPATDVTTVPYVLPNGERTGWLVVVDALGKEVKRMQITNSFTSVTLSTEELAAGTYSYRIEAGQSVIPGEKLLIIH